MFPVPTVRKICCIGANKISVPFASVVALKCRDIEVKVIDLNEDLIMKWNLDKLPMYENNLPEIIKKCRNKNLIFTNEKELAIEEADVIFICCDTELETHEFELRKTVDLKPLEDVARLIAETATTSKIIVVKSTVAILAADTVTNVLKCNSQRGINFTVLSNPEFLTQGTAINDIISPDRVLIGGDKTPQVAHAMEVLISIYEHWVPRSKIITTDLWSSLLAKLATNVFLAQKISSINSLTEICEVTNADMLDEEAASRIGPKGLQPSIGFGGPTFARDLLSMIYLCESLNLPEVANYWQAVLDINEYQKKRFSEEIIDAFNNTLKNKKIAILGFAFRKDTEETINSPAIYVCTKLLSEGAKLNIYDPVVPSVAIINALKEASEIKDDELMEAVTIFHDDPYDSILGTSIIVICTDWAEFKTLDYFRVYNNMIKPAYIFDGMKMLPHTELMRIGFKVFTVGKKLNMNVTPVF